jgi:hypothetical protein
MQPKTEKRPYLAGFLINHKHIAWSDKKCSNEELGPKNGGFWGLAVHFHGRKRMRHSKNHSEILPIYEQVMTFFSLHF